MAGFTAPQQYSTYKPSFSNYPPELKAQYKAMTGIDLDNPNAAQQIAQSGAPDPAAAQQGGGLAQGAGLVGQAGGTYLGSQVMGSGAAATGAGASTGAGAAGTGAALATPAATTGAGTGSAMLAGSTPAFSMGATPAYSLGAETAGGSAAAGSTAAGTGAGAAQGAGMAAYALPAAGLAAGAYGLNTVRERKYEGTKGAAIGGASGAAAGAAIGTMLGGPGIGTAVGALAGAGYGYMKKKPQTQQEEGRWRELANQGFTAPDWVTQGQDIKDPNAWYRGDLGSDFRGYDSQGGWVNNKFAKSRDVKDLQGADTIGYAAWGEKLGKGYQDLAEADKIKINQEALNRGLISEGKGTIDVKWNPELEGIAQALMGAKKQPMGKPIKK